MAVTAIVSLKGGSGKTTTALNLGASLARKGYRILLVDMDPQASLSHALGFRRESTTPTITDVLTRRESIHDVIWRGGVDNVYLCPSDIRLIEFNRDSRQPKGATRSLAESLRSIKRKNSHVIVDCPSALTPLTEMALRAADYFLVPTQPTPLSTQALDTFLSHIDSTKKVMGSKARLVGVLLTMVNPYLRLTVASIRELRANFRKDLFKAVIRQSVRLAESPGAGQSIFEYAPKSIGAENFNRLRKEFLRRTK